MSTFDEVKGIISKITHYNEQDMNLDTSLADLNADSLHWVQIIVGVESVFDIEIDIEKMSEFTTVGDFVNHVEELMA